VPVVPLAAAPLANWLNRAAWPGWTAATACWLAGATLTLIGLIDPQRFYHQPNGRSHLVGALDDASGTSLANHLVAFQTLGPSPLVDRVIAGALGAGLIVAATVFVSYAPRLRERSQSPQQARPVREW
jgi:hypothetical protein